MHASAVIAFLAVLATFSAAAADPGCGCLKIKKVYDANANGRINTGEPIMAGWRFTVRNVNTAERTYQLSNTTMRVPAGKYEVCDDRPDRFNWYLTADSICRNYTVTASETCVEAVSTCVCTGPGTGKTSGQWWSGTPAIAPLEMLALRVLPLTKPTGSGHFDPTTLLQLKDWYNAATPTSPAAYYLSAQLALAKLNLMKGYTSIDRIIKAPQTAALLSKPHVFVLLGEMTALATTQLTLPFLTTPAKMLAVATELKNVNTNENFIQPETCPFTMQPLLDERPWGFDELCPAPPPPCQQGCLQLSKTLDTNANGIDDAGEPPIVGWKFRVRSLATNQIAYYVTPSTLQLPLGSFEVCDVLPQQYNWQWTGTPQCQNYTLTDTTCVSARATCLCTGPGTAQPSGYWVRSPGLDTITLDDLLEMTAHNLVNADGSRFALTDKAAFPAWFNGATTANAAYYLSAHMAVTLLNTQHNVAWSALIKTPALAAALGKTLNEFARLHEIFTYAEGLLASGNGAEMVKVGNVLKDINANQNFAQTTPCFASFPAVISSGSLAGLQPPCGGSNPSLLLASSYESSDDAGPLSSVGSQVGQLTLFVGIAVGVAALAAAAVAVGVWTHRRRSATLRVSQSQSALAATSDLADDAGPTSIAVTSI